MMKRYQIELVGMTPLLMRKDNRTFGDKIKLWQLAPENKETQVKGDDRAPAWTWIGCLYHDTKFVGLDADNIKTVLKEGGGKVPKKGMATYKKQTQSGIIIDQQQFELYVDNRRIPLDPIKELIGNNNFFDHIKVAEELGFELLVKPVKIGRSKWIRVRPLFRNWVAKGTVTVLDEEIYAITKPILESILRQAGALCGVCDWRPMFGKFSSIVTEIN